MFKVLAQSAALTAMAMIVGLHSALAHQQKEAYITLLFNQNSGNLEVSHRFLLHDAEHVLGQLFDLQAMELSGDLISDAKTQAAFAAYVETRFELADNDKQPLPLNTLGFEVDGKHLWVYQETKLPNTTVLLVKHTALHELWSKQTNHVNVEKNGKVVSVRLQKQDSGRWRAIKLPTGSLDESSSR